MNKEFEAIVMNAYAELCIMWRVAHVTNQTHAEDFDAKLKALESVVAAFDLNTPEGEEIPMPPSAPGSATAPAEKSPFASSTIPPRAEQSTTVPAAPSQLPAADEMVLED